VTVLDLVETPSSGAGLGNVATVIGDLLQEGAIDPDALAEAAADYPSAVAQRTGYLVEHMAGEVGTSIQLDRLEAARRRRDLHRARSATTTRRRARSVAGA
jgi:hypothetical protein